ncbi:aminodeoxychorismate synthase component I [Ruminiclostridium herbifermentans]|uniref:aminodeoxychorismate synthase n=1 Tax=Ruminiclostridium herbifermentans TaxID=2488810 RepID=A0A4U7JJ90_9FIRM|nr:aminodeoxychorismate synthase component I [Ruminiclostridium herbifermentans]QNU66116.1 aminodeoxychorismate synthase component I [Ruminiclostridium herbifermentans]
MDKVYDVYIEEINTNLDSFQIYKQFHEEKFSFFLDSAMDAERLGKYSFIGFEPFLTIENKADVTVVNENGNEKCFADNPFDVFKKCLSQYKIKNNTSFPFVGGAVGFFSYDLCHNIEKLPKTAVDDLQLPDLIMGFYDGIVIIEHTTGKVYAASAGLPEGSAAAARLKLEKIKSIIERNTIKDLSYLDIPFEKNTPKLVANFTQEQYFDSIEKAKKYIECGDIYQMNMTQRFTTQINRHPINIYEKLRTINPAPFASYFNYDNFIIVSSSPERFLQIRNRKVETRPIKGTIPRGKNNEEDKLNKEKLYNSVKDRAENLMIVDLMRNDLGRVCEFGSVEVPELFCVEQYSTVFHLVSTVIGILKEDKDAVDCIKATFPGGSITGAPKIRAMEIIDELEPTCRHLYTGSIGYIGFDGDMDINIVIRTILIKKDIAYYQVGGGIVWDSEAEKEYHETLDKGKALKEVLLNI